MVVVAVVPRGWSLAGLALWMGKEWGGEVGVAVWFVWSWCSLFVVAGRCVCLPGAKARIAALLFSVSLRC